MAADGVGIIDTGEGGRDVARAISTLWSRIVEANVAARNPFTGVCLSRPGWNQ
jgi:hypothetical protein